MSRSVTRTGQGNNRAVSGGVPASVSFRVSFAAAPPWLRRR
ncbi:MAG: hypothetical protein OXU61_12730 [Gammaproteobacteria bacterium]|nr:hypothetical protein [Gammaproteobacteria bacterium]